MVITSVSVSPSGSFVSKVMSVYLPSWSYVGVQSNVAPVKVAPSGRLDALYVRPEPEGSSGSLALIMNLRLALSSMDLSPMV